MHLTPQDLDKLMLHQAGVLAQKRLARGVQLNYPEAVALLATQVLEFIRDGRSVAELMDLGRRLLGRADVMEHVPDMLDEVQVEGTFPDGTKLVTIHHPIALESGDLSLALYGSFLPVPERRGEAPAPAAAGPSESASRGPAAPGGGAPGAVSARGRREDSESSSAGAPAPGGGAPGALIFDDSSPDIEINAGRATIEIEVTNSGDRPIQVGSHYHFSETNRALVFDRARAYGFRLDIPAGTAVRFEPGQSRTVALVAIAGHARVRGGNNFGKGPLPV